LGNVFFFISGTGSVAEERANINKPSTFGAGRCAVDSAGYLVCPALALVFSAVVATRIAAGLVMYRRQNGRLEFFLAHPGGPLSRLKDDGHWTIPKGEQGVGEELLEVAKREFEEETGIEPHGPYIELGSIRQKGGKWVFAWAFEGDHSGPVTSNSFVMEWPPKSGKMGEFPEVDRAEFFSFEEARQKIKDTQFPLLERLLEILEA
jgi:predicted NUDIX family NTP pyrophosphohydrolase